MEFQTLPWYIGFKSVRLNFPIKPQQREKDFNATQMFLHQLNESSEEFRKDSFIFHKASIENISTGFGSNRLRIELISTRISSILNYCRRYGFSFDFYYGGIDIGVLATSILKIAALICGMDGKISTYGTLQMGKIPTEAIMQWLSSTSSSNKSLTFEEKICYINIYTIQNALEMIERLKEVDFSEISIKLQKFFRPFIRVMHQEIL